MRSAVLVAILGFTGIAAAGAATVAFAGGPAEGGRSFGEHVSGMAPEHALAHGAMFGECASTMAEAGDHSQMQ